MGSGRAVGTSVGVPGIAAGQMTGTRHGKSIVRPSQVVATPGTVHHKLVEDENDARAEPVDYMAEAALWLATEPLETTSGRVTYSQEILKEAGRIEEGRGIGFERPGSGYSRI